MAHEEIVRRAVELIKAGRKKEARALLNDVLQQAPEDIGALSALARASETEEEAIAALERVLAAHPDDKWAQRHLERLRRGSKGTMDDHPSTKSAAVKDDWVTADAPPPPAEKPAPKKDKPPSEWESVGWQKAPGTGEQPAAKSPDTNAPHATGKLEPTPPSAEGVEEDTPRSRTLLYVGGGCLVLITCLCVAAIIGGVLFGDLGQEIARDIIEDQMGEFGAEPGPNQPLPDDPPGGPPVLDGPTPTLDLTAVHEGDDVAEATPPPAQDDEEEPPAGPVSDFDDDFETTLTETITLNQPGEAALEEGDVAHNWLFDVEGGEQFVITVTAEDDDALDTEISVYGENGNLLAYNDDGGEGFNSQVQINVQSGQTLTLRVSAFSGSGPYTITVEPLN